MARQDRLEKREKLNIFLLLVTLIIMAVLVAVLIIRGSPGSREPIPTPEPTPRVGPMYAEPEIKRIGVYNWVPVYIDDIPSGGAYMHRTQSRTYMNLEEFCLMLGLDYEYTEGVSASIEGVEIERLMDDKVLGVNGRYFYLPDGLGKIVTRELYPLRELAEIVGAELEWDAEREVLVMSPQFTGIENGNEGYYDEDDLLWLSHIINAESRNQPLEGQIAVGNVVLNRVKSGVYPDTVEGVVFDTKYGVQFSPVMTGSIYDEPSDEAIIAAKICLEGYNLVPDCLYFVNNELASEHWFTTNRTFVAAIGDHDFYA